MGAPSVRSGLPLWSLDELYLVEAITVQIWKIYTTHKTIQLWKQIQMKMPMTFANTDENTIRLIGPFSVLHR